MRWASLSLLTLVVAALYGCDPRPYRSGADSNDADADTEVTEATADWIEATFGGIYQLDSYHVSEDSCSAAGVNRRAEAGDFFWVHADTGPAPFGEMCVCGVSVEQCESFADTVAAGGLVLCPLQRIVTERTHSTAAKQQLDIPGTWDGANNCVQGGTEVVTFERIGDELEIDHQQTLTSYVVTDGMCTPARGRAAAQGRSCTSRDVITGTLITE